MRPVLVLCGLVLILLFVGACSDGNEAPDSSESVTQLIAQAPDEIAALINVDAGLLGENWEPDWSCDGVEEAASIEARAAGVISSSDDPRAEGALDIILGTLGLLEDWLIENDC